MRIKSNQKNTLSLIVILCAFSVTVGLLHVITLYALLAAEIILLSPLFFTRFWGKITKVQFLWIISTAYMILNVRSFNFYTLFFILNTSLGLMVLICIQTSSSLLLYDRFKIFAIFGLISGLSIFIEVANPEIITRLFRVISPNDLTDIQIFLKRGRYLGITNYVWYTTILLYLGGGYIVSEYKNIKTKQKVIYIVFLFVLFAASFLSGSRSAILFFPFMAVLLYGKRNTIWNAFLAAVIVLILYYFVTHTNQSYRVIKSFQHLIDRIAAGDVLDSQRLYLRELAVNEFKSHLLFGIGLNEFRNEVFIAIGRYYHAHNLYLQLLAENGIIGTIIIIIPWIATYFKSAKYVFRNRSHQNSKVYTVVKYCFLIQTLIYVDSFIHVTIYDPRTMLIFYIICGITLQLTNVAPDTDMTIDIGENRQ